MNRLLLIFVIINIQHYGQTATTLIELLNPLVMIPTMPAISENTVVFIDYRNFKYSIFGVDVNTKVEQVLVQNTGYIEPQIRFSDNRMVWIGYPNITQADLFLRDLSTNITTRITEDAAFQNQPDIYQTKVVWQDYRNAVTNSKNSDIYFYDLLSGLTKQITTNQAYQAFPSIWENFIVWEDHRNAYPDTTNADIYLYNLLTNEEIQITSNPSAQLNPDIWGDKIVWEDYRNGNGDIYMFDLSTNTERAISTFNSYKAYPVIYGNWIVWQDYRNGPYADIYGFNLATNQEYPVIIQPHHQDFAALNNLNLIWQDFQNNRQDLYRAILKNETGGSLNLLSPNGGENWHVGNSYPITWNSINVSNVRLEYTTNNGSSWTVIVPSTSSNVYNWTIPNTPSAQCRVKITDINNLAVTDQSDGMFTISEAPSITIISPNGGENWHVGNSYPITWNSVNVSAVRLEYTTNNGSSWTVIVPSTSSNVYNWTIPNTPSAQCRVKITDINNLAVTDQSDGIFTISEAPSITIISPNGGENWHVGNSYLITWNSVNVSAVRLEYTTNNGSSWTVIVPSTSSNVYNWTIPNTPSVQCRVKITDINNLAVTDQSDGMFTISESPSITVISPNGGENWQVGSSHTIRWDYINVSNVKIEYSTNHGTSWVEITASTPSDGSYLWIVPNAPSTQCLVRITDVNSAVADISDEVFTISPSINPVISVAMPNGGEHYEPGSTVSIKWVSQDINNVIIDYSSNNGIDWNSIVTNTPAGNGTYNWVTPDIISDDYLIRICDAANPGFCDQSDSTFKIAPIAVITIINPNGGEVWQVSSIQDIVWTSSNVINVKIELSIDNGANWIDIISSVSNSGSYSWVIPNSPSFQSLVKISDVSDFNIYDISDNVFTISEIPLFMDDLFTSAIPDKFNLHQNFPNPFNPSTSIYYSVPEPSFVKLEIFTLLGEKIAEIVSEHKVAGNYVERFNFENYNSGIYLCVMQAGSYIKTRKMVFLK